MKKSLSFLTQITLSILFLISLLLNVGFAQKDKTPSITKNFTLNGAGTLEVSTSGGGITIEGHDGNKVEVMTFVRHNGKYIAPNDPFLSTLNETHEMKTEMNGSTVVVYAKRKKDNNNWKKSNRISIAFHVKVPHQMSTDLNTSGGGISVSHVSGSQNMNTSGGGITLSHISGATSANTSGGGIHVTDQDGNISLHTSGGGIHVKNSKGDISGYTSGGGIHLHNVDGEVDVKTSGGGIQIEGRAAYVKASTSGGNINVDVTNLTKGIQLSTSGGGIQAKIPGAKGMDLNLKASRVHIDLQNFSGKAEKGAVVGDMNGGGMAVKMHASGGNISVEY